MKKLYLIRHAKSSWDELEVDDFDRDLNKRGYKNAPMMAKRLKKGCVEPDIILSSSAKRAKKTAKMIAEGVGYSEKIVFDDKLYVAMPKVLLKKIKNIKDKHKTAFLIGHNPELNMLAEELVGFDDNIVTCGVLEIQFSTKSWDKISADNAKLISYDYPKKEE